MPFTDRREAGRRLAQRLAAYRGGDVVVLALPRGGVPVAFEVARVLRAPLDVLVVRKLGLPYQPELALGAIGEGGVRVLNREVVQMARLTGEEIAAVEDTERIELQRRAERFRAGRPRVPLRGRTALIVDDGVATGSTARAACLLARAQGAARVVFAVPVGAPDALIALGEDADKVVWLEAPSWFHAVGQWYRDFQQTSDQEVTELLHRATPAETPAAEPRDSDVEVMVGSLRLAGHLTVPEGAVGFVVFAHGSGSSRHSPRNREVAAALNQARLGTLLFDLLTAPEELDRARVFDVELLAYRLTEVTRWVSEQPGTAGLPVGYFGASTGAAAALWAAADPRVDARAVVCRGGRPDLARDRLPLVHAPTLLIVGGRDATVLELNRQAQEAIAGECELAVVPGATHLFAEPGTLDEVSARARDWFISHLTAVPSA
ncbi:phosphoribosyltransferase [Amycolatopsis taiwanensis]|uniref:Phosphoribosyltransferase domain-containing protein n=1 Tax=Amycolatopsis taiwanensis TaxID=342230 RepID=A0A9W6VEI5_9PSEU|nr:phosphoribosyltransferase [Amycolatopsis taiwanensis]GLY68513.1 hypothetical protein Atai01_51320 [Amycolatopsis taiwanensis]